MTAEHLDGRSRLLRARRVGPVAYYWGWVNRRYRLVLCVGARRVTVWWREPSYARRVR